MADCGKFEDKKANKQARELMDGGGQGSPQMTLYLRKQCKDIIRRATSLSRVKTLKTRKKNIYGIHKYN